MTYTNTAILTGNMGSEAKLIEKGDKTFASFSIATTDSYKNEQGEWVKKDSVWHDILIFNPRLVQQVKAFKKGTRLTITGFISYRPFEETLADGRTITKKEASIVAGKIEMATLSKS